jgi:hypothetical protein
VRHRVGPRPARTERPVYAILSRLLDAARRDEEEGTELVEEEKIRRIYG